MAFLARISFRMGLAKGLLLIARRLPGFEPACITRVTFLVTACGLREGGGKR